jgi:hypothetical protein
MKSSLYWETWQNNRINYVLSKYGKEFFKGKKILELGPFNGYIGSVFQSLGADVKLVEGREKNVERIKSNYPNLNVECADLDTQDWNWGTFDIIINFGLFYHLEKFHKEHLVNCVNKCNLLFFESVIYDSFENELFLREESGHDQSMSDVGGIPTTSFIESIFQQEGVSYEKICVPELGDGNHHYDWIDLNTKKIDPFARRFWIAKK